MFSLAMEAKRRGMGVVGSTQNILDFITYHVKEAITRDFDEKLQFILGTESGMVTAIVGAVQKLLGEGKAQGKGSKIEVEIVFPVSSEAITEVPSSPSTTRDESNISKLSIVHGVSSGEGCSISGGCASCPYMKVSHIS
jgi:quinolinate synthase